MSRIHGNIIDRGLLGFADEAKRCFAFLESLNFKCVQMESTIVRWESSTLAINVYHGRSSFEIGITIEELYSNDIYPFPSLLRLVDRELAVKYKFYAAHTAQNVSEGLISISALFRRCIETGTLSDNSLFPRLKLQRAQIAEEYAIQTQFEQARKNAAEAWKRKEFGQFINLMAPFQNFLSPVEVKQLAYAKKYVK